MSDKNNIENIILVKSFFSVQTSVLYSTGAGHVLQDTVPHFLLRLQNQEGRKYFHENDSLMMKMIQQLKLLVFIRVQLVF